MIISKIEVDLYLCLSCEHVPDGGEVGPHIHILHCPSIHFTCLQANLRYNRAGQSNNSSKHQRGGSEIFIFDQIRIRFSRRPDNKYFIKFLFFFI